MVLHCVGIVNACHATFANLELNFEKIDFLLFCNPMLSVQIYLKPGLAGSTDVRTYTVRPAVFSLEDPPTNYRPLRKTDWIRISYHKYNKMCA